MQRDTDALIANRRRAVFHALHCVLDKPQADLAMALWELEFGKLAHFSMEPFVDRLAGVVDLEGKRQQLISVGNGLLGAMESNVSATPTAHPTPVPGQAAVQPRQLPVNDPPSVRMADSWPTPDPWESQSMTATPPPGSYHTPIPGAPTHPTAVNSPPPPASEEEYVDEYAGLDDSFVVFNYLIDRIIERISGAASNLTENFYSYALREVRQGKLSNAARIQLAQWCTHRGARKVSKDLDVEEMSRFVHLLYVWSCEAVGPVIADRVYHQATRETDSLPHAVRFSPRKLF